jgi:hypothetical protein
LKGREMGFEIGPTLIHIIYDEWFNVWFRLE